MPFERHRGFSFRRQMSSPSHLPHHAQLGADLRGVLVKIESSEFRPSAIETAGAAAATRPSVVVHVGSRLARDVRVLARDRLTCIIRPARQGARCHADRRGVRRRRHAGRGDHDVSGAAGVLGARAVGLPARDGRGREVPGGALLRRPPDCPTSSRSLRRVASAEDVTRLPHEGSYRRPGTPWAANAPLAIKRNRCSGSRCGWREVSRSLRSRFWREPAPPGNGAQALLLETEAARSSSTFRCCPSMSGTRTLHDSHLGCPVSGHVVMRGLASATSWHSRRHCRGASSEHEATSGKASPFLDSPLRRPQ